MGFGTDLLGNLHSFQTTEFQIRGEVLSPFEVLRSAIVINAKILREAGRLGCAAASALADLIVVDGNPLEDLSLFTERGENVHLVIKDGRIYKEISP